MVFYLLIWGKETEGKNKYGILCRWRNEPLCVCKRIHCADERRDSYWLTTGNAFSSTRNLGSSTWSLMRSEGQSPTNRMEKKWKYPVTKPAPHSGMKAQAEEGQSHWCTARGLQREGSSCCPATTPHPIPQTNRFVFSVQFPGNYCFSHKNEQKLEDALPG